MTTDEIMALGGQLVARNVRQLQGLGSEAETRESYVALQSAIEALQADAARLDYIASNARCDPKMDGNHVWWPTSFNHRLIGPNLREAIDAAMALDKP